jgi:hypothetical protein
MRNLTCAMAVLSVTCLGSASGVSAGAVVIVREDGGFEATTVRTLRSMLATELRKHGLVVGDESPTGSETLSDLGERGIERIFVLHIGRLDKKVPFALEEQVPGQSTAVSAASLTAASVDEADTVIERLVTAVLAREPVERGARMASVTDRESTPFRKKPGEGLWTVGLGLTPLGGSLGWSYEAKQWRLGVLLQGAEDDVSFFGIDAAWIPRDRDVSPYVGVGLGIVGSEASDEDSVLGAKIEVGVEVFRLHGVRLLAGVNAVIPFERLSRTDGVNPGVHLRFCF